MSESLPYEAVIAITLSVGLFAGCMFGCWLRGDIARYNAQRAAASRAERMRIARMSREDIA